jgi:hypothetical protein
MLQTGGGAPSTGGLDPALRRPSLPERRRAATKVAWPLLRPDLHRLVIVSFQDAPGVSNLKTARALGLTIPPHVLLQATELIQWAYRFSPWAGERLRGWHPIREAGRKPGAAPTPTGRPREQSSEE